MVSDDASKGVLHAWRKNFERMRVTTAGIHKEIAYKEWSIRIGDKTQKEISDKRYRIPFAHVAEEVRLPFQNTFRITSGLIHQTADIKWSHIFKCNNLSHLALRFNLCRSITLTIPEVRWQSFFTFIFLHDNWLLHNSCPLWRWE